MRKLGRQFIYTFWLLWLCAATAARVPQPIQQLLAKPYMRGASFSLLIKETESGRVVCAYDTLRQLTPASVMKLVTTATALELMGEDYRYPTRITYDGHIEDGTLRGNLYIEGSGDPSLGSAFIDEEPEAFARDWIEAIRRTGIRRVTGSVVADASLFDTEGLSLKWAREDLGSYYGTGSYGLSVFDNRYTLLLRTGAPGSRPRVTGTEPALPDLPSPSPSIAPTSLARRSPTRDTCTEWCPRTVRATRCAATSPTRRFSSPNT